MMNNYTEIFCLALSDFSRGEVSCQIVLEEVLDIWIVQYFLHYSSKQRNWRGQSFTTSVVSQYHEIAQHKRLSHSNFKLGAKIELVKVSSPTEEQVTHCLKITQNVSFWYLIPKSIFIFCALEMANFSILSFNTPNKWPKIHF